MDEFDPDAYLASKSGGTAVAEPPLFGGSESSLRPEERSKPLIPPAAAKEIVGQLPEWAGGNTKFAQGVAEGTTGALSEFSKPSAILQVPEFLVPGVAETYAANVLS